jgi:beta-lactamase regulating signal transducer with metallopeptidase domain
MSSQFITLVSPLGLLDLALKSAAVMLLAVIMAAILGRVSAAWRHLVWCLGIASLLLLPALSLVLPAWRVSWLPRWADEPMQVAATGQVGGSLADRTEPPDEQPRPVVDLPDSTATPVSEARSLLPAAVEPTDPVRSSVPWLAIVWGAGAVLSLVPLGVGLWQLAVLHRSSPIICDPRWLALLDELRRQLAVRRGVELRQCEAAIAPLTWGALRPVLLVPAEAGNWPDERRRLVLLHELAHVRRWDWLTQLVAHFACALYWFNPLVWLAARQMRIERERACDDLVLATGARASDYAQELLALAAGLSHSQLSPLVAVQMARRGVLEDRLHGILDSRRNRAALTTAAVCLGAALAAAVLAPLAMLHAAPPKSPQSEAKEPKPEPPVKEKPTTDKPVEAADRPRKDPLVGKEAAERVKKFRPAFSKAQEGVEIGISLASDRKAFHEGERVPLEFVIRNVSQKSLQVEHSLYPPEAPPTVFDGEGKQMPIEKILLLGSIRLYRDVLKPNEVAVYRHLGLGLGEKPQPPGTFWYPFLKNAVPGNYRLSQEVSVTVREVDPDTGSASFHASTGEVEFEVKPADATGAKTAQAVNTTDGPAEKQPVKQPEKQAEKQPQNPPIQIVPVHGKVVDDATGKPIGRFVIQGGKFEPPDSKKVTWGYWEIGTVSGAAGDGSFTTSVRWPEGWTARIVANGYLPQPVLTSAPPEGKDDVEVTIRLKRGRVVRGVVLDHAMRPLKDAAVFELGSRALNLAAGEAWSRAPDYGRDGSVEPVRTDEQGRFELPTGEGKTLAVSHAKFDAWPAAIPESGDITVRLPEPARVEINLDIDGAGEESVIFYQLLTHLAPEFGALESTRHVKIANPGKLLLDAMPPGKYQLCRRPGRMLDREMFELKPGETKTIDYVRKTGARVRGKVTWPAETKLASIVVSVVGETTLKSPFDQFQWNNVFASLSPDEDGTFLTERIPPGTYQLQAYAFLPLTPEQQRRTGAIAPSFHAQIKIEVPVDGELKVEDLALKAVR